MSNFFFTKLRFFWFKTKNRNKFFNGRFYQQKYIQKLEEENTSLKTKIKTLQEKIALLEEEIKKKSHPNPKGGV
jgi:cell shape-determining protein MreC